MTNTSKITIACLILIIGILSSFLYLQNEKLSIYQKVHDIDRRCIQKQDSIITVLEKEIVK